MEHGLSGPVALEDVVALLGRSVALAHSLLVDVGNRVLGPQRGAEVLEGPEGRTREVGHAKLFLQMPVEEAYGIAFRPVAVAVSGLDVEARLGMSACVAVGTPFCMQEMGIFGDGAFFHFAVVGELPAVPSCPDGGRIDVDDVGTEVAASDDGLASRVEAVGKVVERRHAILHVGGGTGHSAQLVQGHHGEPELVVPLEHQHHAVALFDAQRLEVVRGAAGLAADVLESEALFVQADESIRQGKAPLLNKIKKSVYKGKVIGPESDDFTSMQNLFNYQAEVIKKLADTQPCVIVGRCANYVLRDFDNVVSVFVHAPQDFLMEQAALKQPMRGKELEKFIEKTDKYRADYYKYYTGERWEDAYNYDLCLNSGRLGFEKCVEAIKEYMKVRFGNDVFD